MESELGMCHFCYTTELSHRCRCCGKRVRKVGRTHHEALVAMHLTNRMWTTCDLDIEKLPRRFLEDEAYERIA